MKKKVIWDRDITHPGWKVINGWRAMPAVYVWYMNQHDKNTVVYVGATGNIKKRLYEHCVDQESPVYKFRDKIDSSDFIPCENYNPHVSVPQVGCDCIPRFFVEYFYGDDVKIWELEAKLINELHPIVNTLIPKVYDL